MKKPADIEAMEEKIEAFKKKEKAKKAFVKNPSSAGSAAKGFQLSVDLVSGVFVGAAIGYFLDVVFHSTPWCLVVLTVLGGIAGILNVYKSAKAEEKES